MHVHTPSSVYLSYHLSKQFLQNFTAPLVQIRILSQTPQILPEALCILMPITMYTELLLKQTFPLSIPLRPSPRNWDIFIPYRVISSELLIKYPSQTPISDYNIAEKQVTMGEKVGLTFGHTFLQIFQGSLCSSRGIVKGTA